MLFDFEHPRFGNFHSGVSIDVFRMKSYVDGPTGVPVRAMVNKLNLVPNRNVSCCVSGFSRGGGGTP